MMNALNRYEWGEPVGQYHDRPIYGGDCAGMMPAVYMTRLEHTNGRYPETEEEYERFGAHLPAEVEVLSDIEIGCTQYQELVAAGLAIEQCTRCPLNRQQHA